MASVFYFSYVGGRGSISGLVPKLSSMLYVSLTMFLAHSASQAMNMSEDADMDRATEHKQNRPIPSGAVEEEEARALSWVLMLISLAFAYLLNWKFGAFTTVLIFMGIFYNLDPIRAKERIISIPWQAVSRGLFLFPAVWAAYGNPFAIEAWVLGLFLFFYVLGFQNSADIIDRHVDAEHGIRTFVVEFGVRNTVIIALGCTLMMAAVIIGAVSYSILPPRLTFMLSILAMGQPVQSLRYYWEPPSMALVLCWYGFVCCHPNGCRDCLLTVITFMLYHDK
jgi:4-hydroxybenzoate polyprenyltransferase